MLSPTAEHTGTDLNLAFKTILERMALIKQQVGEKAFEQHRHAIIVFTDGGCSITSARREMNPCRNDSCPLSKSSIVILSVLSGIYNMGGSPLPTVAKIKNMVYMNHTNDESDVHPRVDYLGKGICHYSVASPITNQPFTCPLQLWSKPQSCLFQIFTFSASGQRSTNQT